MRIFGSFEALPRTGKKFNPIPITIVLGEPSRFTEADVKGGREVYQRLSRPCNGGHRGNSGPKSRKNIAELGVKQ